MNPGILFLTWLSTPNFSSSIWLRPKLNNI